MFSGVTGGRVVVVVGRRKAARSALRRLGLEMLELDHEPRSEQAHGGYGGAAEPAIESVRAALGDFPPAAVVAAAEGAVPTAAAIRGAYGMTGISAEVALRCHDKVVMKRVIAAAGVPCAPWHVVDETTQADELIDRLGLPLVLKEPVSSGGRGVAIGRTREEVVRGLKPGQLAEAFVDGIEMSVESLMFMGEAVFRNQTRYLEPRWANVVPAALGVRERKEIEALVDAAHTALGAVHGMTHIELFLTEHGPVFGEIAARPPGGRLMELIERAYGFDPWDALVEIELGERPSLPKDAKGYAGVYLLHPGAGEVDRVSGVEEARSLPGVMRLRVAVKPGDSVPDRIGSGQSVGELVVETDKHESCAELLLRARALIKIELRS